MLNGYKMALGNLWKRKSNDKVEFRCIKTIRGQKNIDRAIKKGNYLIHRKVEPFSEVIGKYAIVKNKKTGKEYKITDFRDEKGYSDQYEVITDWTYLHHEHNKPKVAAYVIPNDIRDGEIVIVKDLIENFIGYQHNQGIAIRLNSCRAIWKNGDLEIQYDPDIDCISAVG